MQEIPKTEQLHNVEISAFELQQKLFTDVCLRFQEVLQVKNFDFSTEASVSNHPVFARAEVDRQRLLNDLIEYQNRIEAELSQVSFDPDHQRTVLLTAFDSLIYFSQQISTLFTLIQPYSPANNRGISPHRSLMHISRDKGVHYLAKETLDRDDQTVHADEASELKTDTTEYGRFLFENYFPDLYENLETIFNSKDSNNKAELGIVNSGMSADVCSQLVIQDYVHRSGTADAKITMFNDPGRYFEHDYAKRFLGGAAFALNTRPNTEHNLFDKDAGWQEVQTELDNGSFVVIQTDIVPNQQEYGASLLLSSDFLEKYHSLNPDQQKRLIFVIDTTLYAMPSISKIMDTLPQESLVITTTSLNKFHQLGFDIGGSGMLAVKLLPGSATRLKDILAYSGLTPSPRELALLQLLLTPEILNDRMRIISANTKTVVDILRRNDIETETIAVDERLIKSRIIFDLYSSKNNSLISSTDISTFFILLTTCHAMPRLIFLPF